MDFSPIKKCYYKKLPHLKKDKNDCFSLDFFGSDPPKWIKLDQIGYPHQLIKLDQIGFPHQFKNVAIKGCHIYRKDKNGSLVFDFFRSDLSKMDKT